MEGNPAIFRIQPDHGYVTQVKIHLLDSKIDSLTPTIAEIGKMKLHLGKTRVPLL